MIVNEQNSRGFVIMHHRGGVVMRKINVAHYLSAQIAHYRQVGNSGSVGKVSKPLLALKAHRRSTVATLPWKATAALAMRD